MNLQFDDMDIDIVQTTGRRRGHRGGPGWYWQDSRLPPVGAFKSVADALRDIIDQLESGKLAARLEARDAARRAMWLGRLAAHAGAATQVLVITDDSGVRALISGMLEGSGLAPICVENEGDADAALVGPVGLAALVADIDLGRGITGFEVARRARDTAPKLPVVYISGRVWKEARRKLGVPGGRFLPRPLNADHLLTALASQLS